MEFLKKRIVLARLFFLIATKNPVLKKIGLETAIETGTPFFWCKAHEASSLDCPDIQKAYLL